MEKVKTFFKSELFVSISLLTLISALAYLPFIGHFRYFNDDWYEIYSANARGPMVFQTIYNVDRPIRMLVMTPAYMLFGGNPLYYNLSAYFFRVLSALGLLWLVRILWPRQRAAGTLMALLFLIYPGFLSQVEGIDYQSQMVSLAAGMFSIVLLVRAAQSTRVGAKLALYAVSILLSWLYLGLVEYFIGFEVVKFSCLAIFALRERSSWRTKFMQVLRGWLPAFIGLFPFLIWRVFLFHSERSATDIGTQLGGLTGSPLSLIAHWALNLSQDSLKVFLMAWTTPFGQLVFPLNFWDSLPVIAFGLISVALAIFALRCIESIHGLTESSGPDWRGEAFWLGLAAIVFGLLPITVVNRQVIFPDYSRYTLASSIGVAMILIALIFSFSKTIFRWAGISTLILLAVMTHVANGFSAARSSDAMSAFWWQVSWRVSQIEKNTTLIANYPVTAAAEDYFVWGPANIIYYPESQNERYVQPGLFAAVLDHSTVIKVLTGVKQPYVKRRGIVSYPNYRNILVLTQPSAQSCVQVMDGAQLEFSPYEDERIMQIAPYSEAERVLPGQGFHVPPYPAFGSEPMRGWCYYYEKAAYARQIGNWQEVSHLADEATKMGFAPSDPIEWMPFVQAYASLGNESRLTELAPSVVADPFVAQQACHILGGMPNLSSSVAAVFNKLYCAPGK